MRKLLQRLLLFLVPIMLFTAFVEYRLEQMPNIYKQKRTDFDLNKEKTKVVVLGSSQVFYGVNPACFDCRGFNLASLSQCWLFDMALLKKYIHEMPQLKTVVISVSYFSAGYRMSGFEPWRTDFYYKYWDVLPERILPPLLKRHSMIALYTPREAMTRLKQGFHNENTFYQHNNGWYRIPFGQQDIIDDEAGKRKVAYHHHISNVDYVNENVRALESFIASLKMQGIVPVLITMPVYKTYYLNTDSKIEAKNSEVIETICRRHKIDYYNYFRDERFLKEDFYDNDHLNEKGAKKLSDLMNEDFVQEICRY